MQSTRSIRPLTVMARCVAVASVALLCAPLPAQSISKQSISKSRKKHSALPATAPTTPAAVLVQPPQYPVFTPPPTPPANPAVVTYSGGMLSVTANNSSLNQILREISHLTGMKITGGVTEERVFTTYGPGTPDEVVTALLDGTSSNFLLVQSAANTDGVTVPVELVLTPRHGGPTPPSPNASNNSNVQAESYAAPASVSSPASFAATPTQAPAADAAANGVPAPVAPPDGSAPAATAAPTTPAATATPADAMPTDNPNGVKSPQQIYEQLLRLRQQPQQNAPN